MLPISYLPAAQRDFDQSFDWYAERSTAAAERFANAIEASLSTVAQNPEAFAFVDATHQQCTVKRFPFRIVFRVLETRILVVAIAHAKRHPDYWQDRA